MPYKSCKLPGKTTVFVEKEKKYVCKKTGFNVFSVKLLKRFSNFPMWKKIGITSALINAYKLRPTICNNSQVQYVYTLCV